MAWHCGSGVRILPQEGNTLAIVEVKDNTITMGAGNIGAVAQELKGRMAAGAAA